MTIRRTVTLLAAAGAAAVGSLLVGPALRPRRRSAHRVDAVPGDRDRSPARPSSSTSTSPATSTEAVDLALAGLPDGWKATLRGGGFVVQAVTATADDAGQGPARDRRPADGRRRDVPDHRHRQRRRRARRRSASRSTSPQQVDSGIQITADFPSLKGEPATAFSYNLTVTNNTPEQQTFTFEPTGSAGLDGDGVADGRRPTPRRSRSMPAATARSRSTPRRRPATAEGQYPIDVGVTAANGATGKIELTAEVTGAPKLALATADQRLDASGHANTEKRVPMIVSNTGTAALEDVKLAGHRADGLGRLVRPAVARRASSRTRRRRSRRSSSRPRTPWPATTRMTVRSSAGSESSNVDLRYTLKGSRTLGFVAIAVIVVAFVALAGVFVRFGRAMTRSDGADAPARRRRHPDQGLTKRYGDKTARRPPRPGDPPGRGVRAARPERRRQDDDDPDAARAHRADGRARRASTA